MKITKKNLLNSFKNMTKENALLIVQLANGSISDNKFETLVSKRVDECYNRPSDVQLTMYAINKILGTYGVEGFGYYSQNDIYSVDFAHYCNAGDTYLATICHDPENGYTINDWGSIYENSPAYAELTEQEGA